MCLIPGTTLFPYDTIHPQDLMLNLGAVGQQLPGVTFRHPGQFPTKTKTIKFYRVVSTEFSPQDSIYCQH